MKCMYGGLAVESERCIMLDDSRLELLYFLFFLFSFLPPVFV